MICLHVWFLFLALCGHVHDTMVLNTTLYVSEVPCKWNVTQSGAMFIPVTLTKLFSCCAFAKLLCKTRLRFVRYGRSLLLEQLLSSELDVMNH